MIAKKPKFYQVQKAVYSALSSGLTGIPVLDYVPENQNFPYISIGEDEFDSDGTKLEHADIASVEVNIWSQARGFSEVKSILENTVSLLSTVDLKGDDCDIFFLSVRQMETGRMTDGITRYGTVVINFRVSQND